MTNSTSSQSRFIEKPKWITPEDIIKGWGREVASVSPLTMVALDLMLDTKGQQQTDRIIDEFNSMIRRKLAQDADLAAIREGINELRDTRIEYEEKLERIKEEVAELKQSPWFQPVD
jgi:hypothetical protein